MRHSTDSGCARPTCTTARGNDLYDPQRLGFVADQPVSRGQPLFAYDTRIPGNGNAGHEGAAYGTTLPAADKWALIEYLKTF